MSGEKGRGMKIPGGIQSMKSPWSRTRPREERIKNLEKKSKDGKEAKPEACGESSAESVQPTTETAAITDDLENKSKEAKPEASGESSAESVQPTTETPATTDDLENKSKEAKPEASGESSAESVQPTTETPATTDDLENKSKDGKEAKPEACGESLAESVQPTTETPATTDDLENKSKDGKEAKPEACGESSAESVQPTTETPAITDETAAVVSNTETSADQPTTLLNPEAEEFLPLAFESFHSNPEVYVIPTVLEHLDRMFSMVQYNQAESEKILKQESNCLLTGMGSADICEVISDYVISHVYAQTYPEVARHGVVLISHLIQVCNDPINNVKTAIRGSYLNKLSAEFSNAMDMLYGDGPVDVDRIFSFFELLIESYIRITIKPPRNVRLNILADAIVSITSALIQHMSADEFAKIKTLTNLLKQVGFYLECCHPERVNLICSLLEDFNSKRNLGVEEEAKMVNMTENIIRLHETEWREAAVLINREAESSEQANVVDQPEGEVNINELVPVGPDGLPLPANPVETPPPVLVPVGLDGPPLSANPDETPAPVLVPVGSDEHPLSANPDETPAPVLVPVGPDEHRLSANADETLAPVMGNDLEAEDHWDVLDAEDFVVRADGTVGLRDLEEGGFEYAEDEPEDPHWDDELEAAFEEFLAMSPSSKPS